jgi:hypothetical protein
MSKYLYTLAAKIDDVTPRLNTPPRQQKPPHKPLRGLNWTVSIVCRRPIPGFMVWG